jgi:acetyl-CoA carboxylase carboxyl transferase subunit alpha
LFRDSSRAAEAADSMMVTAKDLKELGIADTILPEPEGGTHLDYDQAASILKQAALDSVTELIEIEPETRILNRIKKYEKMGRWSDG